MTILFIGNVSTTSPIFAGSGFMEISSPNLSLSEAKRSHDKNDLSFKSRFDMEARENGRS